jgi:hypothetical protein
MRRRLTIVLVAIERCHLSEMPFIDCLYITDNAGRLVYYVFTDSCV